MKLKKLPIGIQTFSEIINKDYIYIDKTNIGKFQTDVISKVE